MPARNKNSRPTPELCAPAGKLETALAALKAGADAIYCGLKQFNARLRQENFSLNELARLIAYAHGQGRKVYLAFNTLIKENELVRALSLLQAVAELKVDAVILADWGLLSLVRQRMPELRIHLSTQAGISNSNALRLAKKMGVARVIPARELSLNELSLLVKRTSLEVEVFIHGALCYSLSGFCLASSFIGGKSGNRGLCTQVCRREFFTHDKGGAFFSPYDLEALPIIPELTAMGVAALKIEGRMKGPDYVAKVVSVYRRALDRSELIDELVEELKEDFGRPKTQAFFSSFNQPILQDPDKPAATGILLGRIVAVVDRRISFKAEPAETTSLKLKPLQRGDAVRIQPQSGYEGRRYSILEITALGLNLELLLSKEVQAKPGDLLFLVGRKQKKDLKMIKLKAQACPQPEHYRLQAQCWFKEISLARPHKIKPNLRSRLWVMIDDPAWFDLLLQEDEVYKIILALDDEGLLQIAWLEQLLESQREILARLVLALPLFIPETKLMQSFKACQRLLSLGVKGFCLMSPNAYFEELAQAELLAFASWPLLNTPARIWWQRLGGQRFCYPLEDDFLNIRQSLGLPALVCLYSLVPLFISRIHSSLKPNTLLYDKEGHSFITAKRGSLAYLLAAEPLCLFAKRPRLEALGMTDFLINLSFLSRDEKKLVELLKAYRLNERILPSSLFNFKRGLF